jgi:hypothetical protein
VHGLIAAFFSSAGQLDWWVKERGQWIKIMPHVQLISPSRGHTPDFGQSSQASL